MKQVNLMEQLTQNKLFEEDFRKSTQKNISDTNEQKTELNNFESRKLCNNYLIPLLYNFFVSRNDLIADILKAIKNNCEITHPLFNKDNYLRNEKAIVFMYQTCLNFVEEYRDFILTNKFSEQAKKELIIMAFIHSDFYRKLLNINSDSADFTNGCYISMDLQQICNNKYDRLIFSKLGN